MNGAPVASPPTCPAGKSRRARHLATRNYVPAQTRQGGEVVHAFGGSPDDPHSLIYATFISAIGSAEREVLLTNDHFVPDPQLRAALVLRWRASSGAAAEHGFRTRVQRRVFVLR